MPALDRTRAERLMAAEGLEALVLLSPESFRHATGAPAGVGTMWRRAGAVAVLIPCDASLPEMAVASDLFAPAFRKASPIRDLRTTPLWVETTDLADTDPAGAAGPGSPAEGEDLAGRIAAANRRDGRPAGFTRPTTFRADLCYAHLGEALRERGLGPGSRIGVELAAVSGADMAELLQGLAGFDIRDGSAIAARLKMVKTAEEIGWLREAVTLAELGIAALRDQARVGMSRRDIARLWVDAVTAASPGPRLTGTWDYVSVGPDPWGGEATAAPGDIVKVDVGCLIHGYTSDTGRTFVFGQASPDAGRIHAALASGFAAGERLLAPGTPLSEIHRAATAAIRAAGFPEFSRGHFGHGLGSSLGSEEWPFIAADSDVIAEPGMVLAFECPWYLTGLGGFILENQYLITDSGAECMNRLPTDLVRL
ncbi:M24 family metallopeptidase [Microvirga tunisiensis]|uniref:M24 family metallopeptidase n=1 Tax=Pannonibacter tanglangensis TaxID=2750084 RepID=A0A7X5J8I9_9HYPH|nr:Xaa-Pro peptidase family protein [Pannonibacter sp. XCT-53]NBN77521.1 M24 family metallopeptidase [Pannonibacter sp. XCT-53]